MDRYTRILTGLYFGTLCLAAGLWLGLARAGAAPPYTRYFGLFALLTLAAELYLVYARQHSTEFYPFVKIIQRAAVAVTVYLLSDGDVFDLSVGAVLAVFTLAARPQLALAHQTTADWLERIDEAILGYLIVYSVHAMGAYGWDAFGIPRILLTLGFSIHFSVVVYRHTRELHPGCRLDQLNAIFLAAGWVIIAFITI